MTALDLVGHSYAVPYGIAEGKGAAQLLAAHLGEGVNNLAVFGAVLYYSHLPGGYARVANGLVRDSPAYQRAVDHGIVWFGGNDMFAMDSTFSAASQAHLKSTFRFALSRMCAGKVFDDDDASVSYSAGWEPTSELGPEAVTGARSHFCVEDGNTATIEVPADFPGGTVAVYLGAVDGDGARWSFEVDGEEVEETVDTHYDYGFSNVLSMYCIRFTELPAGEHTIVCTANEISAFALFDSWAIEAPEPPTVIVPGQFKFNVYTGGETHTPNDTDVENLQKLQREACEEFGSYVKFVSLSSMDHTTHLQVDNVHPTEEGHQEIFDLLVAALEAGEGGGEEGEIVGAHMDFGFVRDSERRLVVAPGAEGRMSQGFVRDEEGRVAVALDVEGQMDYGFIRDEDRRLVIVEGEIDHIDQGLPRDAEGRLVVTTGAGDRFSQGFLRDAEGRIVVVGLS